MSQFEERTHVPPALPSVRNNSAESTLEAGNRSENSPASAADSFSDRSRPLGGNSRTEGGQS